MEKGQSMHNFANHGKEFGFYSKYNKGVTRRTLN